MFRINLKITIFLAFMLYCPTMLWATRGANDYGIIMVLMFIIYSLPIGSLLLFFIIYSIIKLNSKKEPNKNQGKIVFILSSIIIFPTIIIPIILIYLVEWKNEMIELMSGVFVPILLLSIISAVLANFVKKRSILSSDDINEERYMKSKKSAIADNKFSKYFIIGAISLLLAFIVFVFKYFFT